MSSTTVVSTPISGEELQKVLYAAMQKMALDEPAEFRRRFNRATRAIQEAQWLHVGGIVPDYGRIFRDAWWAD